MTVGLRVGGEQLNKKLPYRGIVYKSSNSLFQVMFTISSYFVDMIFEVKLRLVFFKKTIHFLKIVNCCDVY